MTSIDEILANPQILKGKIPNDIISLFQDNPNWAIDTTKKGRNKGKGVVFREVTSEGNFTGRIIQWHPGDSTYHGPDPYGKVSTGEGGTVRIGGGVVKTRWVRDPPQPPLKRGGQFAGGGSRYWYGVNIALLYQLLLTAPNWRRKF